MSNELEISYKSVADLVPYANNSRTHSDEQVKQIAASIKEFGFLQPIVIDADGGIITGHGRLMALKELGIERVPTIQAGHLTDEQRRAYVIADNKLNDNSGWDNELLSVEIEALRELDFDIDILGFDEAELIAIEGEFDLSVDDEELPDDYNPYTQNIKAPTYEAKGEKPDLKELVDFTYHDRLVEQINASGLNRKEKAFLLAAAQRHAVFNFSKIADYYAHSGLEMQELMEASALVIIDYNKALENGFIRVNAQIAEQYENEATK